MTTTVLIPVLGSLLSIALLYAAIDDWRRRIIENWLNLGIVLAAPLWWWANEWMLWPDIALQVGIALAAFAVFVFFFAIGAMGGGDVKLIAALGLWFPLNLFVEVLTIMAVLGGLLTLVMLARHRITKAEGPIEVPYGIAIALAAIWVLLRTIF
ncbi:MAG: prepilin peptidase [Sphingomonadaceae bacterium]